LVCQAFLPSPLCSGERGEEDLPLALVLVLGVKPRVERGTSGATRGVRGGGESFSHQFRARPKLMPWAQKSVRLKEKAGTGGPTSWLPLLEIEND